MTSRLAIGTVQFGAPYGVANREGQVSPATAAAILHAAWANGIRTLDTAALYGESELRLGEIGVDGWEVVTKLPILPVGCEDIEGWVEREVTASLTRLRLPSVHGLLLHRPGQLLEPRGDALYAALVREREGGRVRKIGISVYEPAELDVLFEHFDLQLVQAPVNILDRRLIESGWLDRLHRGGVELHARSVFLQGLLLMEGTRRPAWFGRWDPVWNALASWLESERLTPLQACLRYVLGFTQVGRVVVGVETPAQLAGIVAAASGPAIPPSAAPDGIRTTEIDLLNPARWPSFQPQ